jgi:hypothetical protein
MPAILWQDVEALQANLSTVSAAAQMIILAHVNADLNPDVFGGTSSPRYHLARCYLAAHLGEIARRDGALGVSGETIGASSISLQYAQASTGSDAVMSTSWGQNFHALIRSSALRVGGGRIR